MADQIEEIKNKTDIVSLISEYVDLKKAGRNFKAPCPFHSEKMPSFVVSPELQIFKCFGCNEAGDAFAFLQKHEGMEFYEALKFLADRTGIKLKLTNIKKSSEKERLYELSDHANKFYQYILLNHPSGREALSYLTKDRGLTIKTIKHFQLGYSPNVPFAIRNFLTEKKDYKDNEIEKVGIGYRIRGAIVDRFRGRVIFPLHDHRGNIAGFAGRIIPKNEKLLPKDRQVAKYINSPETPIYHKSSLLYGLNLTKQEIKKEKRAIVVEGELDLISSWQAGVKNTVALKGSAFTQEQARLISRFAKRVVLALDTDIAGDEAARRGITIAENAGLEVEVAILGDYKDPDEMARKDEKEYKKLLKNSVSVWDFIIDSIFSKHNQETGPGKARISKEVVPQLASIEDDIVQAHYSQVVARRLKVPLNAVIEQIKQVDIKATQDKPDIIVANQKEKKTRKQLLEERLFSLAFQFEPKMLLKRNIGTLIATPLLVNILTSFKKYTKTRKKFKLKSFANSLPEELVDGFSELVIKDSRISDDDLDSYKKEADLVLGELEILKIRFKLSQIAGKIRKYEKEKKKVKLKSNEKKFAKLSNKLTSLEEKLGN